MKKLTPYVAVAAISVLVTASSMALYPTNSKEVTAAVAEFDHSNCQYPTRWSNPVDGCDNSDPAVPECTKAWVTEQAEKDCIDAFVAKYNEQNQTPVATVPTTPVVTPPAPVTCK